MRKTTTFLGMLFSIFTLAAETNAFLKGGHRFYLEPDFSYEITSQHIKENYLYKKSGFLLGCNLGYEFLKPNYLYVTCEHSFGVGSCFVDVYLEDHQKIEGLEVKTLQNKTEGLIGYTLDLTEILFTPFTGAGHYFFYEAHSRANLAYLPIGIRAEYRMSSVSIGIKALQLHFVHLWHRSKFSKLSENVFEQGNYGYEISLPLSFKLDLPETKWHGSFEPYYLKIIDNLSFLGGRFSMLYNF